jgi:hypothetical protein
LTNHVVDLSDLISVDPHQRIVEGISKDERIAVKNSERQSSLRLAAKHCRREDLDCEAAEEGSRPRSRETIPRRCLIRWCSCLKSRFLMDRTVLVVLTFVPEVRQFPSGNVKVKPEKMNGWQSKIRMPWPIGLLPKAEHCRRERKISASGPSAVRKQWSIKLSQHEVNGVVYALSLVLPMRLARTL